MLDAPLLAVTRGGAGAVKHPLFAQALAVRQQGCQSLVLDVMQVRTKDDISLTLRCQKTHDSRHSLSGKGNILVDRLTAAL